MAEWVKRRQRCSLTMKPGFDALVRLMSPGRAKLVTELAFSAVQFFGLAFNVPPPVIFYNSQGSKTIQYKEEIKLLGIKCCIIFAAMLKIFKQYSVVANTIAESVIA